MTDDTSHNTFNGVTRIGGDGSLSDNGNKYWTGFIDGLVMILWVYQTKCLYIKEIRKVKNISLQNYAVT